MTQQEKPDAAESGLALRRVLRLIQGMDSSDKLPKHLLVAFTIALVLYAAFFAGDQYLRHRRGPWEVQFSTNENGWAQIQITQRKLGIEQRIQFQDERATNTGTVVFAEPRKVIPFGRVKFEDLTYLPGSVAFDFFGHEVELLPRTLYLNKQEHAWSSNSHVLTPEQKLPPEMSYDPRKKKRRFFGGSRENTQATPAPTGTTN